MVRTARVAAAALVLTGLVACGSSEPPADEESTEATADVHERQGTADETVFDDLVRTEDKARSVNDTVMQDKAHTDAAIEAATDGDAAGQDTQQ